MQLHQESNSGDKINVSEGVCRQFSLAEILAATDNFSDSLVIGHGGFATVYKGEIENWADTFAIKQSKSMSSELRKEFRDEISMVSKFRHSYLVSLIGYCETENEMILVYEYMAGGTLADNLHKIDKSDKNINNDPLCWVKRLKICIGAARGLDYLHTGTGIKNKVIHRDVKSSNILLDENRATAKISDFGMSKIGPANQADTRVMTRVVGTFGYLDPDYYSTGFLTSKSDVYAFGVVLFEVLCGRAAVDMTLDDVDQRVLVGWARLCVKKGRVEQIIDPNLKSQILPRSLSAYVKIAYRCLHACPKDRPTMTEVLAELVFALSLQESTKENGKKSGGSKIAEKLLLLFSATPRPVSAAAPNDTEVAPNDTEVAPNDTEAAHNDIEVALNDTVVAPNDTETEPNDKQAVNISYLFVYPVQLDELKEITYNFSTKALIGEGTCGEAYYGILKSGKTSCIKKLDFREFSLKKFLTQVSVLSKLKHENVVELLHYCVHDHVRILVYEYAPNGSLHDILHGQKGIRGAQRGPVLSWSERVKIAIGAAKGLEYLHDKARHNMITHRAIKSSNVLVFNDGMAKIADIKFSSPPRYMTRIIQPVDRDAPDNEMTGQLSSKGDVYNFGVVLLELLSGRKAVEYNINLSLVHWATRRLSKGEVEQCIDPRLNGKYPLRQAAKMAEIASLCVEDEATLRPSMSIVVKHLQTLMKATPGPS